MESIETIAIAVLLAVSLVPLTAFALRNCDVGRRALVYALLFALVAVLLWTGNLLRPTMVRESDVRHRPIRTPSDGYVSSQTCNACHPRFHASWHNSYHSKMTQLATLDSVAGDFNNVDLQHHDARYRLVQRDGEFFVGIKQSDQPDEDFHWRQIVMTTGSHHRLRCRHNRWYWRGRRQRREQPRG